MINRRTFLKGVIGTSIIPASLFSKTNIANSQYEILRHLYSPRDRRIFCQFEHQELETEIEKCAQKIGCEVLYGEPFSPDILALGGLIFILDRNLVGIDMWEEYVGMCDEFKWDEPCLIVDIIEEWPLPKSNYVSIFDLNDPASVTSIIYVIKEAKIQNIEKRQNQNFNLMQK